MDHFKPHRKPKFEGYYTRFLLPSGGSLVLVMCSVPFARDRRANIALAYVPPGNGEVWRRELWPESITPKRSSTSKHDFELVTVFKSTKPNEESKPGQETCRMTVKGERVSYELKTSDVYLTAEATNHTPWSTKHNASGPEGWLAHLPLPLHWHVLSLASTSRATIRLPRDAHLDPRDAQPSVQCTAHIEKNWATSFPSAHVWVQAYRGAQNNTATSPTSPPSPPPKQPDESPTPPEPPASHLSFAGGRILGLDAYLISYRTTHTTPPLSLVFRPPWTLALPLPGRARKHLAPFTSCTATWPTAADQPDSKHERSIALKATSPLTGWKLEVRAAVAPAPEPAAAAGGFFTLSAPHPDGFRDAWMAQSLRGVVAVRVSRRARRWCGVGVGRWEVVWEETIEGAGVEFGGECFPLRGSGLG